MNMNSKPSLRLLLSLTFALLNLFTTDASSVSAQSISGAAAADYIALIVNSHDNTVSAVDVESGLVIQTIPLSDNLDGGNATCIATTPDDTLALITYSRDGSHRLIVLDTTAIGDGVDGNEKIVELPLQQTETQGGGCIAVTPDSARAYVAGSRNAADIAVIDIAAMRDEAPNNEVTWIDMGAALFHSIIMTPDGSRAYATDDGFADSVYVFDTNPASPTYDTRIAQIDLHHSNTFPRTIAMAPDGKRIFVGDSSFLHKIFVIDTNPASSAYHTTLKEIDLARGPNGLLTSADGTRLYVSDGNQVRIFDIEAESATLYSLVDTIVLDTEGFHETGLMARTRDGDTLIALRNSRDSISIIDTSSLTETNQVSVGDGPTSLALYRAPIPDHHIQVVSEADVPVKGAYLYQDGDLIGVSDDRGLVVPTDLVTGTHLVAMQMTYEQPTIRAMHQAEGEPANWAWRVYLTSLTHDANGEPIPYTIRSLGPQKLMVRKNSPLVLFNLVVSIEWDASAEYLNEVARAMHLASDFLYDYTDGQMAFGPVAIYDHAAHWSNADIQIAAWNDMRPHAYVDGIHSADKSQVIRLGRHWDGKRGDQGAWDASAGFRTLAHEFGHYALALYDEYFYFVYDSRGMILGTAPSSCTGLDNHEATNASVMDYHYTSSELSARGVDGLWSANCERTVQWDLTKGLSTWETLRDQFADTVSPPRWQLVTPLDRKSILPGPTALPTDLLNYPQITVDAGQTSAPVRRVTVLGQNGAPAWGSSVTLYEEAGQISEQGFTNEQGQIDLYGAHNGDVIRAARITEGLVGEAVIDAQTELTMTLAIIQADDSPTLGLSPFLLLTASQSPDPEQINMQLVLSSVTSATLPTVLITEPGSAVAHSPELSYSATTGVATGQINFGAAQRGAGSVQLAHSNPSETSVYPRFSYLLQQIDNRVESDLYSSDGKLTLHMAPGSLPVDDAYIVVTSATALPGPLPQGMATVDSVYTFMASSTLLTLEKPALLSLRYESVVRSASVNPAPLLLYRWLPDQSRWSEVAAQRDDAEKALVAPVTNLGTYAVLMSTLVRPTDHQNFLPLLYLPDVP